MSQQLLTGFVESELWDDLGFNEWLTSLYQQPFTVTQKVVWAALWQLVELKQRRKQQNRLTTPGFQLKILALQPMWLINFTRRPVLSEHQRRHSLQPRGLCWCDWINQWICYYRLSIHHYWWYRYISRYLWIAKHLRWNLILSSLFEAQLCSFDTKTDMFRAHIWCAIRPNHLSRRIIYLSRHWQTWPNTVIQITNCPGNTSTLCYNKF